MVGPQPCLLARLKLAAVIVACHAFGMRNKGWLLGCIGAVLTFAGVALAEQGTVTLGNGNVVTGEVLEIVPNNHVTLRLPGGQVKAFAWVEVGQIGIGGQITIGGAPPSASPPPPPPAAPPPAAGPVYQPAPPPPPGYQQPAYGPPPPPPPPARRYFDPAWVLGVRVGTLLPGGNLIGRNSSSSSYGTTVYDNGEKVVASNYLKTGWSLEGNVGFHFSPAWTIYGYWEHGRFGNGADNASATGDGVTNSVGAGLNANANPRGAVGLLLDIGVGWRWLQVPSIDPVTYGSGNANLSGPDIFRGGIGLAIPLNDRVRLDLEGRMTVGVFTSHSGSCLTVDTCGQSIDSSRQGTFITYGLRAGIRWDLR